VSVFLIFSFQFFSYLSLYGSFFLLFFLSMLILGRRGILQILAGLKVTTNEWENYFNLQFITAKNLSRRIRLHVTIRLSWKPKFENHCLAWGFLWRLLQSLYRSPFFFLHFFRLTVKEKGCVRLSASHVKFADFPTMNLQFIIAKNVCLLKEEK